MRFSSRVADARALKSSDSAIFRAMDLVDVKLAMSAVFSSRSPSASARAASSDASRSASWT